MPDDANYRAELEYVQRQLSQSAHSVRISGTGRGLFVVAKRGRRSVEIYRDDDEVIVDPAQDDTLLGEVEFSSYDSAITAALRWLGGEPLQER
jgi:hypothetical protein